MQLAPILRLHLHRYLSGSDIDDTLQIVFLEAWRRQSHYDSDRPLTPWLLTIARRRAIDHLRRRHDHVLIGDAVPNVAGSDGREFAERLAGADAMRRLLAQLPAAQSQVLVLAYYRHLSQTEIATTLATPLGTIKTRTSRGLRRLRELMTESERIERASVAAAGSRG